MRNTLDGITILRFTKAFQSGGGIEIHLNDLDKVLLARNKVTIMKVYLETKPDSEKPVYRAIGQGNLIEVPITVSSISIESKSKSNPTAINKLFKSFFKKLFRDVIIYNPFLYRMFFRDFLKNRYHPSGNYPPIKNAGAKVRAIYDQYHVDLLVLHAIGSSDTAEILQEAKRSSVPSIYINHFSNEYFDHILIREQLVDVAAIAGLTNVGVPKRLKNKFYCVSNGIDLELFDPSKKQSPDINIDLPIIIYPARIIPSKGQKDLVYAYLKLRNTGLRAKLVFAGRIDSVEYANEIKQLITDNTLDDDILFLEQMKREELRDWYGISSILAFPTYHQEGLPRILMEAQAMKVPPVAYIIGGIPGALKDGKTGYLVKKGDIKTFSKRMGQLLTNREKMKRMGEAGREFVQRKFSLDALAERHEKLYLSVLNRKQSS